MCTNQVNYDEPHRYGLEVGQTRNLYIESEEGVRIGAWHHLPDSVYKEYEAPAKNGEEIPPRVFEDALRNYPTIVFLHGNGLNRAADVRVHTYKTLSESQNANVFAIDYRGFGDSEGTPSEEGVVRDARAAVNYVLSFARGEQGTWPGFAIAGQSLGTGIAAQCARNLYDDGIQVDAIVLLAAFTSLRPLVTEFRVGGVVPLLGWLNYVPFSNEIIDKLLAIRFDTEDVVRYLMSKLRDGAPLKPPIFVVMHAADDKVIDMKHSDNLFQAAYESLGVDQPDSIYVEWASTAEPGFFRVLMHRSHPKPSDIGRIAGARVVLPRAVPFTLVDLNHGGHDRLLEHNADILNIVLPTKMYAKRYTNP